MDSIHDTRILERDFTSQHNLRGQYCLRGWRVVQMSGWWHGQWLGVAPGASGHLGLADRIRIQQSPVNPAPNAGIAPTSIGQPRIGPGPHESNLIRRAPGDATPSFTLRRSVLEEVTRHVI